MVLEKGRVQKSFETQPAEVLKNGIFDIPMPSQVVMMSHLF